ncbi:hypothetical protein BT93_C0502 [Corymbia citriodora subsp. variegata]|nr:hypothetical protein BT93_C0502 [Corymbia citriodora subsp. variegata]
MMTILFSAKSFFSVLVLLGATSLAAAAATSLPDDEVEALKEIAATLGKTDWNFSADPCSKEGGWSDNLTLEKTLNHVDCSCNFTDTNNKTVCHVTHM